MLPEVILVELITPTTSKSNDGEVVSIPILPFVSIVKNLVAPLLFVI